MAEKLYSYTSRDNNGNEIKGSMEASSVADLMTKLRGQGLILIKHNVAKTAAKQTTEAIGSVGMKDVIPFTQHLKSMYSAGVPLLTGLEDLKNETQNPYLSQILDNVCISLKNGVSLSDALSNYPNTFPKIYIALAKVGEATGNLDVALDSLVKYLKRRQDTKGRLVGAMIYPAVLIVAITGLIIVLLTFLLPKIAQVYIDAGITLPGPTRFLMAVSGFITDHVIILSTLVAALVGVVIFSRINIGLRLTTDRWILKIPFFGSLLTKDAAATFCNTLSVLQKSGVEINESLGYCEEVMTNFHLKKKINQVNVGIQEGERLPVALKETGVFPSLVMTMVKVGDESGHLDESLQRICEFYDEEIPRTIDRCMQILEYTIIFVAGGLVLFIILATLMPIYSLVQMLNK